MDAAVHGLARRGVEEFTSMQGQYQMPGWGVGLLVITLLAYLCISSAIQYTLGRLIPTLAIIESPSASVYAPLALETSPDDPIKPPAPVDAEVLLVKEPFITSSFRRTIAHLRSRGGFQSRFRGVSIFLVSSVLTSFTARAIAAIPFVHILVASLIAKTIMANLSLAWTHIVISEPSSKPWYRRMPESRLWRKVAGPTALLALLEELAFIVPAALAHLYGMDDIQSAGQLGDLKGMPASEVHVAFWKSLSVLGSFVVLTFALVIPASVSLVRVQASLLPDSEETVVPFDRTFGGKVVPEIVGGSGAIGIVEAWTTFDWQSRVRLFKVCLKALAVQVAVSVLFVVVGGAEILLIASKSERQA